MIKIAIFVEGLTETTFIEKIIAKRYGESPCRIIKQKLRGWDYISFQPRGNSIGIAYDFYIFDLFKNQPSYTY